MFLEYINYQHPNINFTTEIESENSLPFLDVLVTHDGSNFSTSLYRKKTFTGLYTEFSSRDRGAGGAGGGFSPPNNFQEMVFSFPTNFVS